MAGTFTFSKAVNPKVSFDKISANECVACYYDSNWWARLVENVKFDEKDVEINFFTPSRTLKQLYLTKEKRRLLGTTYECDM